MAAIKMFRRCGFASDTDAFQQAMASDHRAAAQACISDRLLGAVCLLGPLSRCQERLAAFREAGITYLILAAQPVQESYAAGARHIVQAFGGRHR
jgi:alkanesulfonate monooxygenase SsuD/methylene tetrahydromethanopterin reductase-like flavin-dependent oxidoreductase (luciferase family)